MTTNCKLPDCYPVSLNIDDDNLVENFNFFSKLGHELNPVTRINKTMEYVDKAKDLIQNKKKAPEPEPAP